jgi:2-(1,2-epoxy-1,2-dihydrophenyl)acetyl-CoA isomerase
MRTDFTHLLIQEEAGIATITMNRPEVLNAVNADLLVALGDALDEAAQDEAVRCIVLKGAGRAFGAGQDLNTFAALYASEATIDVGEGLALYHRVIQAMQTAPKPVLAAVQGVAAGASCNLALACDLRIAADNARFIQAFARIGLVPDAGGAYFLPRLVGTAKALELALLADEVSGPEAQRLGLVNWCVPLAEFEQQTYVIAERLAQGPTQTYGLIKDLIYRSQDLDLAASLQLERTIQNKAINTADHREGVMAFLEKRRPTYRGQ